MVYLSVFLKDRDSTETLIPYEWHPKLPIWSKWPSTWIVNAYYWICQRGLFAIPLLGQPNISAAVCSSYFPNTESDFLDYWARQFDTNIKFPDSAAHSRACLWSFWENRPTYASQLELLLDSQLTPILVIENYDYFQSQIYTPSEYEHDKQQNFWIFGGQEVSYSAIFSYLSSRVQDQHLVDKKAQDTEALVTSIPHFTNLGTIYLSFTDEIKSPFRWFGGRVCLDCTHCLTDHLMEVASAIVVAQLNGVAIKTFEVSGFHSRIDLNNSFILELMSDALKNVHELRAINSPTMLECFCQIPLPSLQRFELANCWLSIDNLEDFVKRHASSLRSIHLEDTWLLQEKINENGIYLSMANARSIFGNMASIRDTGILNELTINRRLGGLYEVHEQFCTWEVKSIWRVTWKLYNCCWTYLLVSHIFQRANTLIYTRHPSCERRDYSRQMAI